MRGYELTLRFTGNPDDGHQYLVCLYKQPLYRQLISMVYHWYDMRILKVPGFRKFERWHHKKFGKGNWAFLPITCRQDIRCYVLSGKGKQVLAEFEVDEATYVRLGGRAVKET